MLRLDDATGKFARQVILTNAQTADIHPPVRDAVLIWETTWRYRRPRSGHRLHPTPAGTQSYEILREPLGRGGANTLGCFLNFVADSLSPPHAVPAERMNIHQAIDPRIHAR